MMALPLKAMEPAAASSRPLVRCAGRGSAATGQAALNTRSHLVAGRPQRAWIAFRDAECKFASSGVEGGSVQPMIHSGCLQGLTDARVTQLGSYLKCEEGDLSCPVPGQ